MLSSIAPSSAAVALEERKRSRFGIIRLMICWRIIIVGADPRRDCFKQLCGHV